MRQRTAERIAKVPAKPERRIAGRCPKFPIGHALCGLNGCTRLKPKSARTCYGCEAKSDEMLELDRKLANITRGEKSGKARREDSRRPARAVADSHLGAVFSGGGAALPLPEAEGA